MPPAPLPFCQIDYLRQWAEVEFYNISRYIQGAYIESVKIVFDSPIEAGEFTIKFKSFYESDTKSVIWEEDGTSIILDAQTIPPNDYNHLTLMYRFDDVPKTIRIVSTEVKAYMGDRRYDMQNEMPVPSDPNKAIVTPIN